MLNASIPIKPFAAAHSGTTSRIGVRAGAGQCGGSGGRKAEGAAAWRSRQQYVAGRDIGEGGHSEIVWPVEYEIPRSVRAEIEAREGMRISRSQLSKALRKKTSAGGGLGTRWRDARSQARWSGSACACNCANSRPLRSCCGVSLASMRPRRSFPIALGRGDDDMVAAHPRLKSGDELTVYVE